LLESFQPASSILGGRLLLKGCGKGDLGVGGIFFHGFPQEVGEVDDVSATTTEFDTDLSGADDYYQYQSVRFVTGNLQGLTRVILNFESDGGRVILERELPEAPANGDEFDVIPGHVWPLSVIVSSVWGASVRTLTSFGTLVADVWAYVTRTLTGGGGGATAEDVWTYGSRTLTSVNGRTITVTPVDQHGDVTLVRGDDYDASEGPAISFTRDAWSFLVGKDIDEVRWTVRSYSTDEVLFTITDTEDLRSIEASGATFAFEPSSDETGELPIGAKAGKHDVQVTYDGGNVRTLLLGRVTVLEDQTR
jgi:hypothetical protein